MAAYLMAYVIARLQGFHIYIASKAESLRALPRLDATVEAEFGDELVEGEFVTLAHHGPRSKNPAPCITSCDAIEEGSVVGLSHFDLDTLGGLLRLAGYTLSSSKPNSEVADTFWQLAAKVDVRGPHRLTQIEAEEVEQLSQGQGLYIDDAKIVVGRAVRCLHAFWAWSQNNRLFPPRDGSAENCTEFVVKAADVVAKILDGDEDLLKAGDAFKAAEEDLNVSSYLKELETASGHVIIVRKASAFTNHLYTSPAGEVGSVVVALRDDFHSITVSRSGDDVPINCCEVVQALWGMEAGGHAGIAGSPRGIEYGEDELDAAVERIKTHLAMFAK